MPRLAGGRFPPDVCARVPVPADRRLSWKARGILAYLASRAHPGGVTSGELVSRSRDGPHAVRTGLAELVSAGFLSRAPASERVPREVAARVMVRDGYRCQRCGGSSFLELDHVLPRKDGGRSVESNLQVLCAACNRGKGAGR